MADIERPAPVTVGHPLLKELMMRHLATRTRPTIGHIGGAL